MKTQNLIRVVVTVVLILAAAALVDVRGNYELIPKSEPLQKLPRQLGEWSGTDEPIDSETLSVLGPGSFLSRVYQSPGATAPVDLFIAYFPSQKSGDTIHSPKNCLPGAGFLLSSTGTMQVDLDGRKLQMNRMIVENGSQRMLVLYWYYAHGRAVASEYAAKLFLVKDALKMNRTDGGMIRVITSLRENESDTAAEERAVSFVKEIAPRIDPYIPN